MMYVNGTAVCPTNLIEKGWDKLAEVAPESLNRALTLPFSSLDLSDYNFIKIVGTIEMTANDWLYLSASNTSAQTNKYFTNASGDGTYKSIEFKENEHPLLFFQKISGNTFLGQLSTLDGYRFFNYDLANNNYFICYASNNTIALNSKVTIYGKKVL